MCAAAATQLPDCVLAPTWRLPMLPTTSVRAPADDRLPCTNLVTSVRRPDVFRANQPGPTSVLHPGDFLAPGRLPNACSTERDFQCRMTTAACARTGGFDRKRVCPRTGVALTAASTARGLPKTTSADDKMRSAGYQPSAPCAERRQFLRILNSLAGP